MAAVIMLVAAWLVGLNAALIRISAEKERAVEHEKAASAARDKARVNEAFALQTLNDVIGTFHDGLRDRPGLRDLRDQLLFTAAEKLHNFRKDGVASLRGLQSAEVLRRTNIALNQRFGDAYFALGRVEDALPYYRLMESLVREMYDDSPENPDARKFMAACSNKLADAFTRLGQLRRARDHYREGLAYRQQWVELLERASNVDGDALMNAKWDISVSYLLLAGVHLLSGDPVAANNALQQSNPWAAAVPEGARFQSAKDFLEMSLRFERYGDVRARIDGFEAAQPEYEEAIRLLEQGLQHPKVTKLRIRRQLAHCCLSLGDALLRLNRDTSAALTQYQRAGQICEELLSQDPQDTESKVLLAAACYQQGLAALRQNDVPRSEDQFERSLELRNEISKAAPQDVLFQADLMMSLARLGLHQDALQIAATMRQRLDEPVASYLAGRCFSVCAGTVREAGREGPPPETGEPSLRHDLESKAVDAIRQALQHGWKDLRWMETDPDLVYIDLVPLLKKSP
jgi:tetratricopeptide (TPR) repeat protein